MRAIDFLKLKSGHLLLVYNDSPLERTPLSVAVWTDADKSYPYHRDIGTGDHGAGYPYAIQTSTARFTWCTRTDKRSD